MADKIKGRGKAKAKGIGEQILHAISHPIRIEIQCILFSRMASPNEIAKELDEGVSNVSHHVKVLKEDGVIRLIKTEPRRGAVEHYYRAIVPPLHTDADWAKLPKETRTEITAVTLSGIIGEAVRALNKDTFNTRKDRHLSRMPMELDEEGWEELVERQAAWLEELVQIKADAAVRLQKAGGKGGRRFFAGIMGFETPPDQGFTDTAA